MSEPPLPQAETREERQRQRELRTLAEAIPQLVWTAGPDGLADYFNRRWCAYTGLTRAEAEGNGWREVVHPGDLTACDARWAEAVRTGQTFEVTYRLRCVDGSYRWFLSRAEPVLDDDGRVVRWFGTCTDVDDRTRAEAEALRENEARLRLALRAADLVIWDWVIDDDRLVCTDGLEAILGLPPGGFKGTYEELLAAVHRDDRGVAREALQRLRGGEPEGEFEARVVRPDGSVRWVAVRAQGFRDGSGRINRILGTCQDVTERKRAEEAQRRNEERFRTSAENLLDCFGIYTAIRDAEGRITDFLIEYVNEAACRTHLLGRDQQVGRGLLEVMPGHRANGLFDAYCRVVETGEPLEVVEVLAEHVHEGRTESRAFDVRASKLGDGFVAAWRDVTQRVRVEEDLRLSEERFRRFTESGVIGIVINDIYGAIKFANDEYLRIIGRSRDEVDSGLVRWTEITPPEWLPADESAIAEAKVKGACSPYEKCYRRKDGTLCHVLIGYALIGEAREEAVAYVLDLTYQKQYLARLEQRSTQLRDLTDAALAINADLTPESAARVITDRAREIIGARQAVTSLTVNPDRSQAIHAVSLAGGEDVSETHDAATAVSGLGAEVCRENRPARLNRAALEAQPAWRASDTGEAAGPRPPTCGWLAAPLVSRDGTNLGLIELSDKLEGDFTGDDEAILVQLAQMASVATENARLYDQLREADRHKDEFLAMLAHELRNPLSAVASASLLGRSPETDEESRAWASDVIERQVQQLTRIVEDLLDISRISQGKVVLRTTPLDASPVLLQAIEVVRPAAAGKDQAIEVHLPPGPVHVEADRARLEQVLVNLLTNAVKYTDKGGRITLTARAGGPDLEVSVRDNGIGIPPEMLPRVFDLFAQVDASIDRSQGGLGIGLSLVKRLIELHGGSVSAASGGPGLGSEFVLRLPLLTEPPEAPSASDSPTVAPAAQGRPRGLRVLVVDDNVDTVRGLARLLKAAGHEVQTSDDGQSALDEARVFRPDAVVLDIGLPGLDGYEVARTLRREGFTDTLLIALSGYGRDEDCSRSRAAGFDHHLIKPVNFDILLDLLGREAD
jgi:PAS domain S-box-containing protein